MLEEYNKEKLHEYAKELFALCLEKGLFFNYDNNVNIIDVYNYINSSLVHVGYTYISEKLDRYSYEECMPICELIEKVKQL